jgi:hypothetical protein
MRRTITIVLVAIAFLAGSLTLSSAGAHDDGRDDGRHDGRHGLKLIAKSDQSQDIDSAPAGPSLGDGFAFHDRVCYRHREVGALDGSCVLTYLVNETTGTLQCVVTVSLPRGTMTTQGVLGVEDDSFTTAITGGTGKYVGAEGQAKVRFVSETRTKIRVMLVD